MFICFTFVEFKNLLTYGTAEIVFATGTNISKPTPGNPNRTLIQHEEEHEANKRWIVNTFDSEASQYMDRYYSRSGAIAVESYLDALWEYLIALAECKDTELEIMDYNPESSARAYHQDVSLPNAITTRNSAQAVLSAAEANMNN